MLRWGLAPAVVSWQRGTIHISLARHSPEFPVTLRTRHRVVSVLCWICATCIRIRFANIVPPLSRLSRHGNVVQDEKSWALCFGRATEDRLVGYHNGVVYPMSDLSHLVEKMACSCFYLVMLTMVFPYWYWPMGEVDSGSCGGKQFAWDMHCNIRSTGFLVIVYQKSPIIEIDLQSSAAL